ncbi:endonuclease/exonuclease/phosphatase family protein [bacterium]|nr:endonuclease/exonuclease/phosphatase family protein [bacterium]
MLRPRFLFLLALLIATLLANAGCPPSNDDGDDDDDDDDDDADDDDGADDDTGDDDACVPDPVTFTTFNAGLAHGFVPYAADRLSFIGDALTNLDSDVVCLQEVWTEEDIAAILAATASAFPYSFRYNTHAEWEALPDEPATCVDIDDLVTCAEDAGCDEVSTNDFVGCVIANCAAPLNNLELDCFYCLASNIDKPFDDMVDICTNPGPPPRQYEGANGLLLLSRLPLAQTAYTPMDSFLIERGVLSARIDSARLATDIYCTHLTTSIEFLPYGGEFADYSAENLAQVRDIIDQADASAGAGAQIVLGDFNAGGDYGGEVTEKLGDHVELFFEADFDEWYPDPFSIDPICTWCGDNPLVGGGNSHVIDHVLLRVNADIQTVGQTRRVLDDLQDIPTEDGEMSLPLSDHYGATMTVDAWNEDVWTGDGCVE